MEDEKRLFPIIKKMGDIERPLCPGTPQGSAWYQIETSEVIRMIKCGGQCYWSSQKVRFTAYVGEGWDFDRKLILYISLCIEAKSITLSSINNF